MKASDVVFKSDDIKFYDWSLHNSGAHFWSCDDIGKCPMLKLAIERAIKKSPHYNLAGNLFNADHAIDKHQFVGFVSSYTKSNVLTSFHLYQKWEKVKIASNSVLELDQFLPTQAHLT